MKALAHALLLSSLAVVSGCGGGGGGGGAPTSPTASMPSGPSAVVALTVDTFEAAVEADGVVAMVEFYSPYCSHCRAMEPIVETVAREFAGRALVAKVDVTAERTLTDAHGVWGYPTFVFFRGGEELRRLLGEQPHGVLAETLELLLAGF